MNQLDFQAIVNPLLTILTPDRPDMIVNSSVSKLVIIF